LRDAEPPNKRKGVKSQENQERHPGGKKKNFGNGYDGKFRDKGLKE